MRSQSNVGFYGLHFAAFLHFYNTGTGTQIQLVIQQIFHFATTHFHLNLTSETWFGGKKKFFRDDANSNFLIQIAGLESFRFSLFTDRTKTELCTVNAHDQFGMQFLFAASSLHQKPQGISASLAAEPTDRSPWCSWEEKNQLHLTWTIKQRLVLIFFTD